MAVRLAETPSVLYRIGRSPDPLLFPPHAISGSGRYDDPLRRRSVLYAAIDRRAVFLETLDSFRLDLAALAERDARVSSAEPAKHEEVRRSFPPAIFSAESFGSV